MNSFVRSNKYFSVAFGTRITTKFCHKFFKGKLHKNIANFDPFYLNKLQPKSAFCMPIRYNRRLQISVITVLLMYVMHKCYVNRFCFACIFIYNWHGSNRGFLLHVLSLGMPLLLFTVLFFSDIKVFFHCNMFIKSNILKRNACHGIINL
ncbi:hypothetical protein EDEG_02997 [Edhazardia aedis USNM 41457]|uniref:Uncharacterized protein n=1 Tax=Edhazardia aedis (strain USNM 41457) TaxID=1003232 RepID=J9DJ32_EDHAE|nr:hypothetical protein EDEG_02997 [Edhazardia aedis USNM 41457]|eukprot:EJW02600.1 hypothetical protein EDEG_02997 [Edhazardia aedis USNM 41457]